MPPPLPARARRVLREQFGLTRLRPGQTEVLASVLAGANTIAIMPTGSGKSLCYQLPALLRRGVTVVVSPLIALMRDQDEKLAEIGVDAAVFNSAVARADQERYRAGTAQARHPVMLVTPERLADRDFRAWLARHEVGLFVVDEAHCISQWGHDFRPDFLEIPAAIRALGSPPVLAMTATATDEVVQDIAATLAPRHCRIIKVGVYRPNLHYGVTPVNDEPHRVETVRNLVADCDGPAIVYTSTIKIAETLHDALTLAGHPAALYHGKLGAARRRTEQDAFMNGTARIMVATDAFGMGIDKPDVRLVVHAQMPGSLDAYYQETGRAGRDGEAARCVLVLDEKDKRVQSFFLANRYPSEALLRRIVAALRKQDRPMSLVQLREQLGDTALRKLQVAVRLLADAGILRRGARGTLRLQGSAGDDAIEMATHRYQERDERDRANLAAMVDYARSGRCRWHLLLAHFGESAQWQHCGHCDSCQLVAQAQAGADLGAAGQA